MSIQKIVFNTDLYCNDLHAAVLYGDGSMLTGLPSSNNNYQGGANNVVLTNNNGNLTDQAYLPVANGGLACDASAFNGIVKANAGTFSSGNIVDADIDVNANISISKLNSYPNDNTKVLLADGTWAQVSDNQISDVNASKLSNYPNDGNQVLLGDGNWSKIVNANVDDNCNLARSKLANATANYILVNDGFGTMSEVQFLDRNKIAVDNANQYKFLFNNNNGEIAANDALLVNGNDLVCNPSSDILLEKDIYADANKKYLLQKVLNVQTTNDTPTAIYSLTCENNKSYLVKFELLLVDSSANSGIINGYCKVKHANSSTQPTASYIISNGSILDNALANCEVQLDVSVNDTFKLMVVGIPATTIDWLCKVDFIKN